MRAFISYTRRDADASSLRIARDLARFLVEREVDVAVDELSFRQGAPLATQMSESIYASDRFIFLASSQALASKYVLNELEHARDRAIELHPAPFFYILLTQPEMSVNQLPRDLRRFLVDHFNKISPLRTFYRIFMSLQEISLERLVAEQLRHARDTNWLMLERHQNVDVYNKDGDVRFTDQRTLLNITSEHQRYTDKMNWWATAATALPDPTIKASIMNRENIEVGLDRRDFRGRISLTATLNVPDLIAPDDCLSFQTQMIWPKAFDLVAGDTYELDCEQKSYCVYRIDLSFPRQLRELSLCVEKTLAGRSAVKEGLQAVALNKFYHVEKHLRPGTTLTFHISVS